jgi:uracil-DNA glycosylase family 4
MTFYFPLPQKKTKTNITYDCNKCGLCDNPNLSNPIFPYVKGKNYNGLVILGQQPSKEDDKRKIPFSNKRAKVVRSNAFRHSGINLNNYAAFTFAAKCHSNKKVTEVQYKCCRSLMVDDIKELKPKLILCYGEMAFKSLFNLKNKIAPTRIRGRLIPNFEFNCLVFTLMNPNDIYNYDQQYALKRDMKRAMKFWSKYNTYKKVDQLLKERKILEGITIKEIKNKTQLVTSLNNISKLKRVAFDYEATNVKPFDKYFEITHIQFGTAKYAWVLHESLWMDNWMLPTRSHNDNWSIICGFMKKFLPNPSIQKVIQNVKFERNVSRYIFDCEIVNTQDPMIASHVIDERRGTTSLDFQNLVRFGIPPYSDTVKTFLQKKNKDDKINRIRQAPYDDMILYSGLDVITTYNQWLVIERILPIIYPNAKYNYEFLHRGHKLFANMTKAGIKIDKEELDYLETLLRNKMNLILSRIALIPEFIEYNQYLEDKTNISKSTDKKLQSLSIKMKGDKKYGKTQSKGKGSIKRSDKPIRRKLSF